MFLCLFMNANLTSDLTESLLSSVKQLLQNQFAGNQFCFWIMFSVGLEVDMNLLGLFYPLYKIQVFK